MKSSSLRLKKLIKELPKNGYNIAKTARQVGYSAYTSDSGSFYERLRKDTGFISMMSKLLENPNLVKEDYQLGKHIALQNPEKPDLTNFLRANEGLARLLGLDNSLNTAIQINIANYTPDADVLTKYARGKISAQEKK